MKKVLAFLFVLIFITAGCAELRVIDYSRISVPQEGGIKFTKITRIEDKVDEPEIQAANDKIYFNPVSIFDLSPDGTSIAFKGWKDEKANIFIKNLNGSRATLQRTFRDSIDDVAYSPDGKTLAFSDYREDKWNIYTTNADAGAAIRQITSSGQANKYPVYIPDGSGIVFMQSEIAGKVLTTLGYTYFNRNYLWSFNLKNSELVQYVEGTAPSISRSVKQVIVTRGNQSNSNSEIWLVDLESGQEYSILSSNHRSFFQGVLSPDGKKIAVVGTSQDENTPLNLDIYVANIDGTGLTQLTFHPGNDVCPRWSPDGQNIFFLSQRGSENGEYNIWKMNVKL
jgi:Tol biopolymer transport system component